MPLLRIQPAGTVLRLADPTVLMVLSICAATGSDRPAAMALPFGFLELADLLGDLGMGRHPSAGGMIRR